MDVRGNAQPINKIDADALAVAVFKGEKADDGVLKTFDKATDGIVSSVIKSEEFSAKEGETAYFHLTDSSLKARRLLLIGCGDRGDYKARQISQMAGTAARFLRSKRSQSIGVMLFDVNDPFCTPILRGIENALYPLSYLPIFADAHNQRERFERYLEMLAAGARCDPSHFP